MWGVITNTSIQSYTPDRTANSLITESPWLLDTEMLLFCYRTCRPSQMGLSACFYSPVVDGSCKVSLSPCYTVCLGLPEIGKKNSTITCKFLFFWWSLLKLNSFYISPSLWGSKFLFWNGWVQGWVLILWDPRHSFTSLCNNSFFFWDPGWTQGS